MGPAGTAVLWNVLVPHVGQEVGVIDTVLQPVGWELYGLELGVYSLGDVRLDVGGTLCGDLTLSS